MIVLCVADRLLRFNLGSGVFALLVVGRNRRR
jgi:hypothetical protein